MEFCKTLFPGVYLIKLNSLNDERGYFVKTYQIEIFRKNGIEFQPCEEFYSVSKIHVLRGMHFQTPPFDHAKLVYCSRGAVLDVLLDLRRSSPTFKKWLTFDLHEKNSLGLFIPRGLAHGFLSLQDNSLMSYKVDCRYDSAHDKGIRWNSFGFQWPCTELIISERDQSFQPLSDFETSFE